MDLIVSSSHDVPLFMIKGQIDHGNMWELGEAISRSLSSEARNVLIDLGEVTYIDSRGLSMLYTLVRRFAGRGWIGIINPKPDVLRLLTIVGLPGQRAFRLFSTREEAFEAVAAGPSSQ